MLDGAYNTSGDRQHEKLDLDHKIIGDVFEQAPFPAARAESNHRKSGLMCEFNERPRSSLLTSNFCHYWAITSSGTSSCDCTQTVLLYPEGAAVSTRQDELLL